MGLIIPFFGWGERVIIGLFGSVFLVALVNGLVHIRAGRVAFHREWMMRAFAIALSIAAQRLISFPALQTFTDPTKTEFEYLRKISNRFRFENPAFRLLEEEEQKTTQHGEAGCQIPVGLHQVQEVPEWTRGVTKPAVATAIPRSTTARVSSWGMRDATSNKPALRIAGGRTTTTLRAAPAGGAPWGRAVTGTRPGGTAERGVAAPGKEARPDGRSHNSPELLLAMIY